MAQASALATGSACAFGHGSGSVVQTPLRPLYSNCTTYSSGDLAEATTSSLLKDLDQRGGGLTPEPVATALRDLVATMAAMADGTASPSFFLSSLDPGVGKTTTLIHFARQLLRSERHSDVAVLLCFSRYEEIARLVEEMGLEDADFAVFTSDEEVNRLSATPRGEARILFTTQEMVRRRCRGCHFKETEVFHYQGKVRAVRIWDEAMLPGEVVSLNTDQLASLRDPLRFTHPALAKLAEELERVLKASEGRGICVWPEVESTTGTSLWAARQGLTHRQSKCLDALYALSGRSVLLRKPHNASPVIAALDSRDALPDDLAPVVILDASGRVRATYEQWETSKGTLVRLPSAARSYKNLTVSVLDRGSGKTAWMKNGGALAQEVAHLIDSKPEEEWLVIYHKGSNGGAVPNMIRGLFSTNPDRVSFLNWGKHQGTNAFRHIKNVILTGVHNYTEIDYEMMVRSCGGIKSDQRVPEDLTDQMRSGEHMHHILQALCRSAVRLGNGSECGPCSAYIIAPKRSGIRDLLPVVFPGCGISTWTPAKVKAQGKVQQALTYVEMHFEDYPDEPLRFRELQAELEVSSTSNFRESIRKHPTYKAGLDALNIEEITVGNYRYPNALAKKPRPFGPVEGASYIAGV